MPRTTIIRACTPDHFNTFDTLVEAYRHDLDEAYCFQAYEAEKKEYSKKDIYIFLAFDDETPCGCIGFWPKSNKLYEMKRLYVPPAYRGQSIGENLVAHGEEILKSQGVDQLVLETLERLHSAIHLYYKRGYVCNETEDTNAHTPVLKMSRRLSF